VTVATGAELWQHHTMRHSPLSRRQFITHTAALAGAALVAPKLIAAAGKRTATDLVTLGKTGIKTTRLGLGTGSNGGRVQFELGQEAFNKLIRYGYDKGIRYFDCAQSYKTFPWIGDAIKDLPREKIFLLSKIGGNPEKPAEVIDSHLKNYKTDYIDCMLVHCSTTGTWTDERKRVMDAIDEAQQKGKIKVKGVSCHALPALRVAAKSDWVQVNLVRVNPQAKHVDGESPKWNEPGNKIEPVMELIKQMHANGHGIIGMKLIGNGDFTNADDREKSIRYAMAQPEIHAVTIGCKSPAEVDEAITRINNALAA
jgi:predicted aldo/keto reductase-like oxidoreductase